MKVKELPNGAGVPFLHLDGTGDPDMARVVFGDLIDHYLPVERNARITQVVGKSFSNRSIRGLKKDNTATTGKIGAENAALRADLQAVLSRYPDAAVFGDKSVIEALCLGEDMARILCAERRWLEPTARQATFEQSSFCLATPKLRARSIIWVSNWKMPCVSPNGSTSNNFDERHEPFVISRQSRTFNTARGGANPDRQMLRAKGRVDCPDAPKPALKGAEPKSRPHNVQKSNLTPWASGNSAE